MCMLLFLPLFLLVFQSLFGAVYVVCCPLLLSWHLLMKFKLVSFFLLHITYLQILESHCSSCAPLVISNPSSVPAIPPQIKNSWDNWRSARSWTSRPRDNCQREHKLAGTPRYQKGKKNYSGKKNASIIIMRGKIYRYLHRQPSSVYLNYALFSCTIWTKFHIVN